MIRGQGETSNATLLLHSPDSERASAAQRKAPRLGEVRGASTPVKAAKGVQGDFVQ